MSDTPPAVRKNERARFIIALFLISCGALIHGLHFYGWIIDDAYISFRYARNLAHGAGLVWNPVANADHVEGYSNFLWVLLCAIAERTGAGSKLIAPMFGAASFVALTLVAARTATLRTLSSTRPIVGGISAGLIVALSTDAAFYAVTGLETVAFALACSGALYFVIAKRPIAFALVGIVAVLLRPEGVVVCAVGLVAFLLNDRRSFIAAARVVCAGALAYIAFKWIYFGSLVPNTFLVKVSVGESGITYIGQNLRRWIWVLAPALACPWFVRKREVFILASFVCAFTLLIVIGGADWMPLGRLIVPILGVCASLTGVLFAYAVENRNYLARLAMGGAITCLMIAFIGVGVKDGVPVATKSGVMMGNDAIRAAFFQRLLHRGYKSAATFDIGLLGYEAPELIIIDLGGLTDRTIARAPGGYFDKKIPNDYLEKVEPDVFIFTTNRPPRLNRQTDTLTIDALYPSEDYVKVMPWFQASYDYSITVAIHETVYLSVFAHAKVR